LLDFKRSLFGGVLDGGASEVFLGGSRLTKFMEGVSAVTDSEGDAEPATRPAPTAAPASTITPAPASVPAPDQAATTSPSELWTPLLSAGLKLIEALTADQASMRNPLMATDSGTGRSYLKIPLPEPQVLGQLTAALSTLLAGLAGKS
jgi:hypothetical protein